MKKLLCVTAALLFIWGGAFAVSNSTEQAHDTLQPEPKMMRSIGNDIR